jgi:electron transfer flavoprotein alpha subunit
VGKLVVNQEKLTPSVIEELVNICPFNAIEDKGGKIEINAGCKMCKICVKKGPSGVIEFVEEEVVQIDKSLWKGVAVYVDHVEGDIHPVTYELIGKARELAAKINHPVYAVFVGHNIKKKASEILHSYMIMKN